ncbi:MAG: hypothetical protein J7K68_01105 [Candidatus Diapherotrites archaeon]|nr:hypothetical protein [Candidatus Diapherotrites archaeon]
MKPFPPTLRERRRYILFRVSPHEHEKKVVLDSITKTMINLFGEVNLARAGFSILQYDEGKGEGIIKTNNRYVDDIIGCLSLLGRIGGEKARIDIISVSGTMKKARG